MSESLKSKTVRGVGWSFADNIASAGVSFLVGLILANLLTPEEYGILAIIMIFIAVSNSIIDSGFSSALIRKTDCKPIDYNTTFYFNLGVSIILYFILYITAPYIAEFFHEPVLIEVTRVISWILIINALAIIPRTMFVKSIDFKTQTKVSLISSVFSGIIGIGMALYGMGVWSLVGQQLSRQLSNTLLLWIYCSWKPAWEFSTQSFKDLFGFGSKLMLSGLIDTLWKEIYYIVIGKFYSSAQLGQYTRAGQFSTIFSSNLTTVIQRVSFPVLSSIQDDPIRLREGYRRIIKISMLVTFSCMLGLAAVAKPMILILIGEKWTPAITYLQIICLSSMLYPLHAINLNILQVKGRSDIFLKLEIIKKIIGVGPILLGVFYGIEPMLWGSVVTSIISYYLNSYYSAQMIQYSTWSQIKDILPTFFIAAIVAIIMWSLTLFNLSMWLLIILQICIGIILAFCLFEKTKLSEYNEIKGLIMNTIHHKTIK